ncbi:MAG: hypothetical protein IKM61_10545 [Eubacteriaceae bacterium]|nr:hypothetical protein [Eubacteriaceae bacterium]
MKKCEVFDKKILVTDMLIKYDDDKMNIVLCGRSENKNVCFTFENASSLRLDLMRSVMLIDGLSVIDHKNDTWENAMRYHVCDLENEVISLFCEKIKYD